MAGLRRPEVDRCGVCSGDLRDPHPVGGGHAMGCDGMRRLLLAPPPVEDDLEPEPEPAGAGLGLEVRRPVVSAEQIMADIAERRTRPTVPDLVMAGPGPVRRRLGTRQQARRTLAGLLRSEGHSQGQIAARLGVIQQTISVDLRTAPVAPPRPLEDIHEHDRP